MTEDTKYLIKLKNAGWSDERIAAKLSIPVEKLKKIWNEILSQLTQPSKSGYSDLVNQTNIALHQYQLLGESFKSLAIGLSNTATEEQLQAFVSKEQAHELLNNFIILNKFELSDPHNLLEEMMKAVKASQQ